MLPSFFAPSALPYYHPISKPYDFFFGDPETTKHVLEGKELKDFASLKSVINEFSTRDSHRPSKLESLQKAIIDFEDYMNVRAEFPQYRRSVDRAPQIKAAEMAFDFYRDLLPSIQKWALDDSFAKGSLAQFPIIGNGGGVNFQKKEQNEQEEQQQEYVTQGVEFTVQEIRHLLSQAFFLNVKTKGVVADPHRPNSGLEMGTLCFLEVYSTPYPVAIERVIAFLAYFYFALQFDNVERKVGFIKFKLLNPPNWSQLGFKIKPSSSSSSSSSTHNTSISIHSNRMEDVKGHRNIVDFANRHIHIGCIIPSMTQEEVLFSCYPECFVSLLFIDTLLDDEVVLFTNLVRLVEYTGYLSSWQFDHLLSPTSSSSTTTTTTTSSSPSPSQQLEFETWNMIVVDAIFTPGIQFRQDRVERDLNKAYLSWVASKDYQVGTKNNEDEMDFGITTGQWGCGAFRGDPTLKFLQQLMACVACNQKDLQTKPTLNKILDLEFSSFKDEKLKTKLQQLYSLIQTKSIDMSNLFSLIVSFNGKTDFHSWIVKALQ